MFPLSIIFASLNSFDGTSLLLAFKQNHSRPDHQAGKPGLCRESEPGEYTCHPTCACTCPCARAHTHVTCIRCLSPHRHANPRREATGHLFLTALSLAAWSAAGTGQCSNSTCSNINQRALFSSSVPFRFLSPRQLDFRKILVTI